MEHIITTQLENGYYKLIPEEGWVMYDNDMDKPYSVAIVKEAKGFYALPKENSSVTAENVAMVESTNEEEITPSVEDNVPINANEEESINDANEESATNEETETTNNVDDEETGGDEEEEELINDDEI